METAFKAYISFPFGGNIKQSSLLLAFSFALAYLQLQLQKSSLLHKSLIHESSRFHTRFINVTAASPPSLSPPNQNLSRMITCQSMSCSSQTSLPTLQTVTISFSQPKDKDADLSMKIKEGVGPNGLGILSITDVPEFPSLRQNLLRLSPRLAGLPEEVKKELEDPQSRYSFGWSHGKEQLESGKPDLLKGSFYANPLIDVPTMDAYLIERHPSNCGANIWPQVALPELEVDMFTFFRKIMESFKALGKLIFDVGLTVAHPCDQYVSGGMKIHKEEGLEQMLLRSRCHKGRLLYYFPSQLSNHEENGDTVSSWCGWHSDYGLLTGLTCGMFRRIGVEICCPDSTAGLYIRTRTGQIAKAPKGKEASGVDRSTFALFMQPDWVEKLNFPEEFHIHKELIPPNGCLTFGEHSEMLLDNITTRKHKSLNILFYQL